jgi:radical SAM protein with 4Fe4S-binding SPASM domain
MSRYVVRLYPDASFIFDRDARKALFFEGSLANLAPIILRDPEQDLSAITKGCFDGNPSSELREDLQSMAATIRSFTKSIEQGTVNQSFRGSEIMSPLGQLAKYARKHSHVITANIELTHLCNQRCRACYLEDFRKKGLDVSALQRVLSQLRKIGTIFISLTGGDVFVRADALDLLEESTRHDLIPEVKTNGVALTPKMIARIAKLPLLDFQVTIYECQDGWSDFTQSRYSFTRLLATLQDLQSAGVPVSVSVLVGKHNIDLLPQYQERLSAVGVANVFYSPYITPSRKGNQDVIAYRLSKQELQLKLLPFLKRLGQLEHPKKYRGCGKLQPVCYAGRDQLAIGPEGDVYPCLDLRVLMGNILFEDVDTIMKRRRRLLRPFLLTNIPKCRTCKINVYCDSCVGTALAESGDFRKPSQHKCNITRLYCAAKN